MYSISEISILSQYISNELKNGCPLSSIQEYLKNFDFSTLDLNFLPFDEKEFKRTNVYRDSIFEIDLIGWGPGQKSPIHDHAEKFCLVRLLKNELREEIYLNTGGEKVEYQTTKELKEGGVTHIKGNAVVHRMVNPTELNTVSLHIYSPPNHVRNFYVA